MPWLDPTTPARVLVVTDLDPATPALLDAVRRRSWRGPAEFRVLVPNPAPAEWHPFHPERRDKVDEAERALLRALTRIQEVVGAPVRGRVSVRHDPMDAIEEMLSEEPFDEIILSLRGHGLERRVGHLGLPVTAVR
ncbi:MAG TPA: universal stress protein [Solirubrobacteraceae bacterium]|nr:universal stress protein [Solirubrobacteraceae bacterium]